MKLEQEAIGPPITEYSGNSQPSILNPVGEDPLLRRCSSKQRRAAPMGGLQKWGVGKIFSFEDPSH
jgi:hypothetical protein